MTAFSSGAAQTLANKLHDLYGADFDVRRGFPVWPTDYVSNPALVAGSIWRIPGASSDSIGKDYPSTSRLANQAVRRYARTTVHSRVSGISVGFSIVHLRPDEDAGAGDRRIQMTDLFSEIRNSSADVDFIVGDFNQTINGNTLDGRDYPPDDQAWINRIVKVQEPNVLWRSGSVKCMADDGSTKALYADIMNIVEFGHGIRKLTPKFYFYDATPQDGTLHAPGMMHSILGVAFAESCSPIRPTNACGDDKCGGKFNNCLVGTQCAAGGICVPKDEAPTCSANEIACSCSTTGCAKSEAQCTTLCLHSPHHSAN
jgi:hypothetical protein